MYKKQRRIPTILALFILFVSLGSIVFIDQQNSLRLQAKSNPTPQEVHFSNISDSTLTVTWYTNVQTAGLIHVKGEKINTTLFDDADGDNVHRPRNNHMVTVKNLTERSTYKIKIMSGSGTCKTIAVCPTFDQRTADTLGVPPQLPPIRGSLHTTDGKPAVGALVFVNVAKSTLLSGRTDSAGLWVIPLTQLRTADLSKYLAPIDTDTAQITLQLSPQEVATAIVDIGSIRQGPTLPTMVIGNSYNLINLQSKTALLANLPGSGVLGSTQQNKGLVSNPTLELLFPSIQNNITSDTQPRIYGTGKPGLSLSLTLDQTAQTGSAVVKEDGSWEWRPKKKLTPGVHFLGASTTTATGKRVSVNRKFTVLKSGERVLGEATASASLTPSPSQVATSTPAITTIPTPTASPTHIPSPTLIPTITLVPTLYPSITPAISPPRSGMSGPLIFLLGTGVALFGLGVKLLVSI